MIKTCIFADEVSKDFDEAVKLCKEAGASHIEVRGGIWGKDVTTANDDDVQRMQDVLSKYDMKIGCIGSPFGKCSFEKEEYEKHLKMFYRMVELAHIFDTKIIRMFAFWVPKELRSTPRHELNIVDFLGEIAPRLKPAAKFAEGEDVIMSLETEDSTLVASCAEARAVIDAVGSDAMTVCWDVNNSWQCREIPYPDGYNFIKGLVTHVHVKPNAEKNIDTIGNSSVSYEQILKALIADGFDACASIEHWGTPELMLKGVKELNKVLAKIYGD
jgi:L-ribulose-5-phosphate 3-epimerase